jgi:hypothetical protein
VESAVSGRARSAYYGATIDRFLAAAPHEILGHLAAADSFSSIDAEQKEAWLEEIGVLRQSLPGLKGWIYLEFDVPRLGSRIDAVIISGPAIFPIEFKCGEKRFTTEAFYQAWDYALDLKNFHLESHAAPIFPILIATTATACDVSWAVAHPDGSRPPRRVTPPELATALREGLEASGGLNLDGERWASSPYQPTPTIIEAARALYANHSVENITRNDAGAKNLRITSRAVEEIVEQTRERREKTIILLTGVPGAGKTLVGLDVATRHRQRNNAHAVFLSGNQPLVSVLQEALTRSELARQHGKRRKGEIKQQVKPFIQIVHHFRDDGIRNPDAPVDHIVIFDEAQRTWNLEKTADFMKRKKNLPDFQHSEAEFLISYLDRHKEWAVVICLVGGGQEIHTGEAGIGAWLEAIQNHFRHWRVCISPDLGDSEYSADTAIEALAQVGRLERDPRLHLATSMRSFRTEKVSAFVKALLDSDAPKARKVFQEIGPRYPIVVSRDLNRAKQWVREHARGSEQYGLLASSQAMRLKPHAIDLRAKVDPVHWFLGGRHDTRSSYYLEDAATEFQVQGLEIDWACVTWDGDLRRSRDHWSFHSFRSYTWTKIHKADRRRYLLNAYRVLLTRARQGMAIFVPEGDRADATRDSAIYDATFDYLAGIGLPVV